MYRGWSLQEMSDKFSEGISTHLDTNGTMGNVSSPTFSLPLQGDLYFSYGVGETEFLRPSPATYVNNSGILSYAQVDEPRFEKEGLLIEGSSTNYALNSNRLDWSVVNCVRTLNTTETIAPDGTNTATKVVTTGQVDPYYSTPTTVYYSPAGKYFTYSIWLWVPTGHSTDCSMYMFQNQSGTNGDPIFKNVSLTTVPTRYEFTRKMFDEDTGLSISIRFDLLETGTLGNTVYCWGAQLEEKTIATSYIPTAAGIVTREADKCDIIGMYNFPNQSEVSVTADIYVEGFINVDNRILSLYKTDGTEVGYFSLLGDRSIEVTRRRDDTIYESVTTPSGYLNVDDGTRKKIAYTMSNDYPAGVYVDSLKYPLNTTLTQTYKPLGGVTTISIGGKRNGLGSGFELNGHIRNIRIYDKALTDTEFNLL